jgi:hypothetical protein
VLCSGNRHDDLRYHYIEQRKIHFHSEHYRYRRSGLCYRRNSYRYSAAACSVGIAIGFYSTIQTHAQQPDEQQLQMFSVTELVAVPIILLVVLIIAVAAPKKPIDR